MSKPKDEKNELTMEELEKVSGSVSLGDEKAVQLPQPPESALESEATNIVKIINSTASSIVKNIK
jgi:hypothetical protein